MTYRSIDEAYKKALPRLLSIARSHLYNADYATDCVHEAFTKALEYARKHSRSKISDFLLVRETMAAVKRDNRHYAIEVNRVIDDSTDNGTEPIDNSNTQ